MKRKLLLMLTVLAVLTSVIYMSSCGDTTPSDGDGTEVEEPDEQENKENLPSVPSERKVTVTEGSAIHANTEALGRLPQGLTEAVNRYMTTYEAMNLQGPVTTFQTNTYTELQRLSSDAVMAYYAPRSGSIAAIKEWAKLDKDYELHIMTIINRTDDEDYLSDHADHIMLDSTGTRLANGSEYYIMPCDEWMEYVWSFLEETLEIEQIKTIVFEEPDLYTEAGYSAAFKREWKKYYGEE